MYVGISLIVYLLIATGDDISMGVFAIVLIVPILVMLLAYIRITHRLWYRHSVAVSPMSQNSTVVEQKSSQNSRRIAGIIVLKFSLFFISWTPVCSSIVCYQF